MPYAKFNGGQGAELRDFTRTPSVDRYVGLVPTYEARRGEFVWRLEPAGAGMRLLLGNGRQYVQVGLARTEADLAALLARISLTVDVFAEV